MSGKNTEENLLYSFKEDSKCKCLPGQKHLCVWQTLLSKANEGPYKGYILSVRCFLGIKPMTLAVLVPDTSNWTTGMQIKVCQIWTAISTKLNYWPEHCSRKKKSYYVFCACTQGRFNHWARRGWSPGAPSKEKPVIGCGVDCLARRSPKPPWPPLFSTVI